MLHMLMHTDLQQIHAVINPLDENLQSEVQNNLYLQSKLLRKNILFPFPLSFYSLSLVLCFCYTSNMSG